MIRRKTLRSKWDDGRIARLKEMWADGFTGSQIAAELGGYEHCKDGGRASILKMARILKLPGRANGAMSNKQQKRNRRGSGIVSVKGSAVTALLENAGYVPPGEELDIPLKERKTIETLEAKSCRWPIGDPLEADFHFCGRKKMIGLPYCGFHSRIAFQLPRPRNRTVPERAM